MHSIIPDHFGILNLKAKEISHISLFFKEAFLIQEGKNFQPIPFTALQGIISINDL